LFKVGFWTKVDFGFVGLLMLFVKKNFKGRFYSATNRLSLPKKAR